MIRFWTGRSLVWALLLLAAAATAGAQGRPTTLAATRATNDLRAADQAVDAMIRDRTLVVRDVQRDALLPDRLHERLDQSVRGVRIVGGDVTVTQTYPYDTATFAGATTVRRTRSEVGFNAGADVSYLRRPHVGVGVGMMFSHASVPLDETATVDAGGAHVAVGIRVRF